MAKVAAKSDLDSKFRELAAELRTRSDELADRLMERARDEIPKWLIERPEVGEAVRSLTVDSIDAELRAFQRLRLPNRLPRADLGWAHAAAQVGALEEVAVMVDGYRRGHQVQWEAWFELVEREEPDPERRRQLLQRGWRFFFDYAGLLGQMVTQEFLAERGRRLRGHEERRIRLVQEVLDGASVDSAELDYDLDGHHLAAIAWGAAGPDALRALARELDRRLLLVTVVEETWWGWLGGRSPLTPDQRQSLLRVRPPAGARLALGTDGEGPDGFRRSHRQAQQAHRAARNRDAPVTHYDEVALEALAAADLPGAREFVARELEGLDGDDPRSRRLRETLLAYFAAGHNAAATAAALGVHEQTIAHRLRAVEERAGRPVAARRAELETALRLREYLPPGPSRE
jgi:DNA-binding PucR family transcriptional regulator